MHIFLGNNEKATVQQHKFYGSMWLDDPLMVDLLLPLGTQRRGQGDVLCCMTTLVGAMERLTFCAEWLCWKDSTEAAGFCSGIMRSDDQELTSS